MFKVFGPGSAILMVVLGVMLNPPQLNWSAWNYAIPTTFWVLFVGGMVGLVGFMMYACVNDARGEE